MSPQESRSDASVRAWLRTVAKNAVALFFGTLAALLLAEVLLRFYNPVVQRLHGDHILLPRYVRVAFDNQKNSRLDPHIAFTRNAIGFRGPDPPRDFDRRLTLVALGGSTTECLYLTEGKSWPEQLAQILDRRFAPLWVNNAGLDGHSSFGHLMLLDQVVVPLKPKVALFLVGLNDVGRDLPSGREMLNNTPPLLTRLGRVSALAALVQNLQRVREAEALHLPYREVDLTAARQLFVASRGRSRTILLEHQQRYVPGYRSRIERTIDVCRGAGIEPVLVTQPALYGEGVDDTTGAELALLEVDPDRHINSRLAGRILEEYNDAVREVGVQKNALVIDVAHRVPKSSRLYYDFVHFTNEGARAVAEAVAEQLEPALAQKFPAFVKRP